LSATWLRSGQRARRDRAERSVAPALLSQRSARLAVRPLAPAATAVADEYNQFTVIVVLTVGTKVMGLIVDAVSDVLNIPHADIQATPELGAEVEARFISGMAKAGDKLVVLLDIDRVLGDAEAAGLRAS
jgi:chemotaxis signal transduction protein